MLNITEVTLGQVKSVTIPYQETLRARPWLFNNIVQCPLLPYMDYVGKEIKLKETFGKGYLHWTGLPFYRIEVMDKYKDNFVSLMLPEGNFASSFLFKMSKDHSFYLNFWVARWEKTNEYFASTYAIVINPQDILDFENENKDLAAYYDYFEKGLRPLGFGL